MDYPKKRNLDGVYFRVNRDGNYDDVCFTDLTEDERKRQMIGRDETWLRNMVHILAISLRQVGDELDLEVDDNEKS